MRADRSRLRYAASAILWNQRCSRWVTGVDIWIVLGSAPEKVAPRDSVLAVLHPCRRSNTCTAARLPADVAHASKGPQTRACFSGLDGRIQAPPPGCDLPLSNYGLVLALEGGHDPNDVSPTIANYDRAAKMPRLLRGRSTL